MDYKAQFPHCDPLVLHAPGRCVYCDDYPKEQAARERDGINFTGQRFPEKAPCPSTLRRPLEVIERWPGNRAAMPTYTLTESSWRWRVFNVLTYLAWLGHGEDFPRTGVRSWLIDKANEVIWEHRR